MRWVIASAMNGRSEPGTFRLFTDGTSPGSPVLSDGAAVYSDGLSERRSGTSKFYLGDILGSVGDITDSTGSATTTDSTAYDSFGNVMAHSGTTPNPFAYCGREGYQSDSQSGLLLLGNRFYSPAIGRFISRDPAGAGDNWYAYCGNNPISASDPSGTTSILQDTPTPHAGDVEGEMDAAATSRLGLSQWYYDTTVNDFGDMIKSSAKNAPKPADFSPDNLAKIDDAVNQLISNPVGALLFYAGGINHVNIVLLYSDATDGNHSDVEVPGNPPTIIYNPSVPVFSGGHYVPLDVGLGHEIAHAVLGLRDPDLGHVAGPNDVIGAWENPYRASIGYSLRLDHTGNTLSPNFNRFQWNLYGTDIGNGMLGIPPIAPVAAPFHLRPIQPGLFMNV